MQVPSPITWIANQIVTAAQLNANIRDAINFLISPPLCIMRQTTVQSIASAGWVSILFDTEDVDRDNGHSTVTNTSRYTAQTAGYYTVNSIVTFAANNVNDRGAGLAVNGALQNGKIVFMQAVTGQFSTSQINSTVFLNVNDYLETQGWQESGGALNTVVSAPTECSTSIRWISTA